MCVLNSFIGLINYFQCVCVCVYVMIDYHFVHMYCSYYLGGILVSNIMFFFTIQYVDFYDCLLSITLCNQSNEQNLDVPDCRGTCDKSDALL